MLYLMYINYNALIHCWFSVSQIWWDSGGNGTSSSTNVKDKSLPESQCFTYKGRSSMATKERGRCQLFSTQLSRHCYSSTDCCMASIHFNFWSVNSQFMNRLISFCLLIYLIRAYSHFPCFVKPGTMVYRKTELLCMNALISSS